MKAKVNSDSSFGIKNRTAPFSIKEICFSICPFFRIAVLAGNSSLISLAAKTSHSLPDNFIFCSKKLHGGLSV